MNRLLHGICTLAIAIFSFTTTYGGTTPLIRQSLSNKHVNAIVQDREGYVWIGTARGLNKYNGYEYFQYFHTDNDESSLPSDLVTALYIDSEGAMWVATDLGIARYDSDSDTFRRYGNPDNVNTVEYGFIEIDNRLYTYGLNGIKRICPQTGRLDPVKGTSGLPVSSVIRDRQGHLWLGCISTQGIYYGGTDFSELVQVYNSPGTDINCAHLLADNVVLFGTNAGIIALETTDAAPATPSIRHLRGGSPNGTVPLPFTDDTRKLNVTFFYRLDNGTLFVGTQNEGLFICEPGSGRLVKSSDSDLFNNIHSPHCTVCYTTQEGAIWLGTFDQGYYIVPGPNKRFNNDHILNDYLQGKFVTRIVEAKDGSLWIGTRYNGLIRYEARSGRFTTYTKHRFEPFAREGGDFIQSLYIDSRGLLWVGYEKKLMYCCIDGNGISSYHIFDLHSDITTICEDSQGAVWTGSSSDGITIYDIGRNQSRKLSLPSLYNNVTNIIRLRSGDMLFACYGYGFNLSDAATGEIHRMELPEEIIPFSRRCISLLETAGSDLWIGTYTRGAVRLKKNGAFEVYQNIDGSANNDIVAIAESDDGSIWLSTSSGLAKFDPANAQFYNFYEYDGIGGDQFHEKAVLKSRDGTIYFGGNHGLTFFDPAHVSIDDKPVKILIEDLKVLNKSVRQGDDSKILSRSISHTDTIVLSHRYNVFSIDYTGIDYRSSKKIKYAYILHNFDKEWNYVGDYRRAAYSNLPPGKYVFEVKAQNPDGIWSDSKRMLTVVIKYAPWYHPLAIAGYLLIALAVILLLVHLRIQNSINKEKIKLIEKKRTLEQQINDLKIRFFTNISHELRTPLSLIFGPAKKLLQENNSPEESRKMTQLLNYYADNLLRLVDQIMDFAKMESETLSLQVSAASPNKSLHEIIRSYGYYAREKEITVRLDSTVETKIPLDEDKYRKIISNLLSNALKYTPNGGHVLISARLTDIRPEGFEAAAACGQYLETEVSDDGIGMAPEDLEHLFKRHRRFGKRDQAAEMIPGKGIGLYYVKNLVEIHKGDIAATCRTQGLSLKFILPADESVYTHEELQCVPAEAGEQVIVAQRTEPADMSVFPDNGGEKKQDSLLIVEDDADLLDFIAYTLSGEYSDIEKACNGAEAVRICREKNINLIVSDIVMPEMDGLELCSAIKSDPELCHILVVLLTARNETVNQIEGYSAGADAYVNKPFDPVLLRTIVANLLLNRARLQTSVLYTKTDGDEGSPAAEVPSDEEARLNPLDRKFVEKLYAYLDRDLSNSKINVNELGKELGFSRTSFYRKIKNLTGYSPNDFLRKYRLHKASLLLRDSEYSIAEIADMVGCGTHSYFSKSFKEEFGISPKDFRVEHGSTALIRLQDLKTEQGNK